MHRMTQYFANWPDGTALPSEPGDDAPMPHLRERFVGAHADMITPSGRTYIDEKVRAEGLGRAASGEIMPASVTLTRYRESADDLEYVTLDLGESELFTLQGDMITIHGPGALVALASALITLQNDAKAREILESAKPESAPTDEPEAKADTDAGQSDADDEEGESDFDGDTATLDAKWRDRLLFEILDVCTQPTLDAKVEAAKRIIDEIAEDGDGWKAADGT